MTCTHEESCYLLLNCKVSDLKQVSFPYAHGCCGSGIWVEHCRNGFSLLHSPRVPETQCWRLPHSHPAYWAARAQSLGSTCAPTCRISYMWASHSVKWIAQGGVTIMSILKEPGKTCMACYDLALGFTGCHFCHTLLAEIITGLPRFQG